MSDPRPADLLEVLRSAGSHPVVRSIPQGAIVLYDRELRYLAAGGLGLGDVGLSPALLEGSIVSDVFPPETTLLVESLYRRALAGFAATGDVPYKGRVYQQRVAPIRDAAGTIIAGISFSEDVTDARRTEAELIEERRRLHDAQAIGRTGSWELDVSTNATSWSDNLFDLWGVDQATFGGDFDAVLQSIYPEDRALVDSAVAACAVSGTPIHLRYRITRVDDGVLRWFDARGEAMYEHGRVARIVGATVDVTEQVVAELETTTAHAFQRGLLAAVGQALIVTDPQGLILLWNPAAEAMYGWSEAEAMGQPISELVPSQESAEQAHKIASALEWGESWTGVILMQRRDGTAFPALVVDAPVYDESGALTAIIGVSTDMTDRIRLEQELTRQAMYDSLTGLPNRALLIDRLTHGLETTQREDWPVAVLFIDIDRFKNVNDASGHLVGDELLVAVANRLSAVARTADTLARFGGDEFVLVCHDTDLSAAEAHRRSDSSGARCPDHRRRPTHIRLSEYRYCSCPAARH